MPSKVRAILFLFAVSPAVATVWHASAGAGAVAKAVSRAKPGDTVVFAPGTYACSQVTVPDGLPDQPILLRAEGKGKVVFTNDGSVNMLALGSYNTVDGIEFRMVSDHPRGSGIAIVRKEHVTIRNCRFFACQVGVSARSAHDLSIVNSEMAYSGTYGIHLNGSGQGAGGHWDPADENRDIEVRNCYLHDAGWNVTGTEGYGFTTNGAAERVTIENCQIDNNSGDGILYEDWTRNSTARYNLIRGSGIAAIWIDNASMSVFDNNYLEANNVAVWLSGEESSNRYLDDFITVRNNIVVHNDWSAFDPTGKDPAIYGKVIFLITSNTRDTYFDNNTVAFNNCKWVVGVRNESPGARGQNEFRNVWFRNNIFWKNTGPTGADPGVDLTLFHFVNNLWDNPDFVDPDAHTPEGYKIRADSAARGQGMLLFENPLDFWNAPRPHLSKTEKYDIGAHQYGTTGPARIGLDLAAFPFPVPPYQLRFKARPR